MLSVYQQIKTTNLFTSSMCNFNVFNAARVSVITFIYTLLLCLVEIGYRCFQLPAISFQSAVLIG